MGGDGRQQDADKPEALRRQDGGGRREPLPGSEARRGNVAPSQRNMSSTPKVRRKVESADGAFEVVEDSGTVAAENPKGQERN